MNTPIWITFANASFICRSAANTFVGLGAHLLDAPGSEYVRASVSTINQHPSYNPSTIANDVSVLILSESIEVSDGRKSVCSPGKTSGGNADEYSGLTLIVSGWGTLSEGGEHCLTSLVFLDDLFFVLQVASPTLWDSLMFWDTLLRTAELPATLLAGSKMAWTALVWLRVEKTLARYDQLQILPHHALPMLYDAVLLHRVIPAVLLSSRMVLPLRRLESFPGDRDALALDTQVSMLTPSTTSPGFLATCNKTHWSHCALFALLNLL